MADRSGGNGAHARFSSVVSVTFGAGRGVSTGRDGVDVPQATDPTHAAKAKISAADALIGSSHPTAAARDMS